MTTEVDDSGDCGTVPVIPKKHPGRKTIGSQRMISDSYQLLPETLQKLRELSDKLQIPKSQIVREGIELAILKYTQPD
jgi:hypothetical protein